MVSEAITKKMWKEISVVGGSLEYTLTFRGQRIIKLRMLVYDFLFHDVAKDLNKRKKLLIRSKIIIIKVNTTTRFSTLPYHHQVKIVLLGQKIMNM
jgi:hypothetical protein